MKVIFSMNTQANGKDITVGDRYITSDQQFKSLNGADQMKVLQQIKKDVEQFIKIGSLKVARKAGLN